MVKHFAVAFPPISPNRFSIDRLENAVNNQFLVVCIFPGGMMGLRILGIDLGIASCGWGVIEEGEPDGKIVAAGVRCFDAPLVDKTGEPKSAMRRAARGQRRVIRRRRQRMNLVRKLLHQNGLLPDASSDALHEALQRISPKGTAPPVTPWALRAAAYERALSNDELSIVLGHIARHRGFKSNSKNEGNANAADETSKMKKAMEATREGLAKYRSFGEMIASDEKFKDRKRNRDKDYSHTAKRSDLEGEVRVIFTAQRRLGNQAATEALAQVFSDAAFFPAAVAGQRKTRRQMSIRAGAHAHRAACAVV